MRKKLYVHVGHYKTGTTALQDFLRSNPHFLRKHKVEYCRLYLEDSKHSSLAFSVLLHAGVKKLMHGYQNPTPPLEMWRQLFDHVRASEQRAVIVSSEELIRLGEFESAAHALQEIASLCPDIDVAVIAYLRNPDSHLRSWYNQLVKMGVRVPDFTSAVRGEIERIHIDYDRALKPWAEAFGKASLVIRDYDRVRSGGTLLFRDFLHVIGLPFPNGLTLPSADPNPRMDERTAELVRLMQNSNFPPYTIAAIREQSNRFFKEQDKLVGKELPSFADVCDQIDRSLARVGDLGVSNVDVPAFRQRLPSPAEGVEQSLLTGVVLKEFLVLRMYINQTLPGLIRRIDDLEEQLRTERTAGERTK